MQRKIIGQGSRSFFFGWLWTISTVLLSVAAAKVSARVLKPSPACFVEGTPVDTIPAQKVAEAKDPAKDEFPTTGIQNVKAGSKVLARDPVTGKTSVRTVTRTFKRAAYALVRAEFSDAVTGKVVETIRGTPEHPFFTPSGMVAMGKLKPGIAGHHPPWPAASRQVGDARAASRRYPGLQLRGRGRPYLLRRKSKRRHVGAQ